MSCLHFFPLFLRNQMEFTITTCRTKPSPSVYFFVSKLSGNSQDLLGKYQQETLLFDLSLLKNKFHFTVGWSLHEYNSQQQCTPHSLLILEALVLLKDLQSHVSTFQQNFKMLLDYSHSSPRKAVVTALSELGSLPTSLSPQLLPSPSSGGHAQRPEAKAVYIWKCLPATP